jgi:hypothetical protein
VAVALGDWTGDLGVERGGGVKFGEKRMKPTAEDHPDDATFLVAAVDERVLDATRQHGRIASGELEVVLTQADVQRSVKYEHVLVGVVVDVQRWAVTGTDALDAEVERSTGLLTGEREADATRERLV